MNLKFKGSNLQISDLVEVKLKDKERVYRGYLVTVHDVFICLEQVIQECAYGFSEGMEFCQRFESLNFFCENVEWIRRLDPKNEKHEYVLDYSKFR